MTSFDSILPTEDCLDFHHGDCQGPVEYRPALSPTGRWFPRCDAHWEQRVEIQEGINARYGHPESTVAPSDFDPYYAGESWDEDY